MKIPEGFESRVTEANGVRLHHVTGGSGPPVLLVPGWPQTWYAWRYIMPRLARSYSVTAVDIRGMGRSEKPGSGYDLETMSGDVVQLMSALGHDSFLYVGHDIGTWIGYPAAARYPDRIRKAVLMDAAVPGLYEVPPLIQSDPRNQKVWHFAFNMLPGLPEILVRGREREYLAWLYNSKAHRTAPLDEALEVYLEAYSADGALESSFGWYRAMIANMEHNRRLAAGKLAMPVMAVGGEHGMGAVMEDSLGPVCDNLVSYVIPDCGHYIPEEAPDALLALLLPFLGDG